MMEITEFKTLLDKISSGELVVAVGCGINESQFTIIAQVAARHITVTGWDNYLDYVNDWKTRIVKNPIKLRSMEEVQRLKKVLEVAINNEVIDYPDDTNKGNWTVERLRQREREQRFLMLQWVLGDDSIYS